MNPIRKIYSILFGPVSFNVGRELQKMAQLSNSGRSRPANRVENRLQRKYGIYVSSKAAIGEALSLPHPVGVVIGAGCRIGDRVSIYQNVTLGADRKGKESAGRYPQVGNDTTIFAGAVLAGNIRVGTGCTIGANSVVLSDVPDGATAVGIPARILLNKGVQG